MGVTFSVVYGLVGRVIAMLGLCSRSQRAKDVELLVLRAETRFCAGKFRVLGISRRIRSGWRR